ncbi:MAG: proteasome ATPase [Syntrophobacteraceae bacterium]|nr:proteasome ATPase [Syntrophobacteraceae bacterium]
MGPKKKKESCSTSSKTSKSRKEVVEAIVREASEMKSPGARGEENSLEEKMRESEAKRKLLAQALHASREKMRQLMPGEEEKDRAQPFGVFVEYGRDPQTAVIRHHGRLYEARIDAEEPKEPEPGVKTFHAILDSRKEKVSAGKGFRKGEMLLLNNELNVIDARGFDLVCGSLGSVEQVLNEDKLLISTVGDESLVVSRAYPLQEKTILPGDNLEYDPDSLFAYNLLPKSSVDRLVLEKVPDISYEDIGGLAHAIDAIRDAIELPHLYPEYFREYRLTPPKGILLYGPPGCGKTLVAKAVASSLTRRIEKMTGEKGTSFFLNVKGPELLNKFVGETEQAIRDLFARARSKATYRTPVIIFFDEMDSLLRVRGSGVSSDMESTIVPQFLAELDGLEVLENVVIIGATNREDLIDPAILRPGRLDRKVRIPRPDKSAAVEIFSKYLTADLPLATSTLEAFGDASGAVEFMINCAVNEMYDLKPGNELVEITYADGTNKILYMKDFASGAIIENIVRRAKFHAVKALIDKGEPGISLEHLLSALRQEYRENEDLPSNTNPAEWYRIIGRGGERVVRISQLMGQRDGQDDAREKAEETIEPGEALD